MSALLELDAVTRRFGGLTATDRCSLEVNAGETHALIGPNGAGKTTLVAQIAGSLQSDEGRIRLDGIDVTHRAMHERVALGMSRSFQITSIFPRFSVLENLALGVLGHSGSMLRFWQPLASDVEVYREAREIAAQVDLANRLETTASTLAHGEQRQLEVGLALATGPKLLLLDEPLAGMGPDEASRMIALIASLKSRTAILLVEHDMDAVFRLADRISVMVSGRVIVSGTPEEVRRNAEVRRAYLGDASRAESARSA